MPTKSKPNVFISLAWPVALIGFESLMAAEHSLDIWACLKVLKNNKWKSRLMKRKRREKRKIYEKNNINLLLLWKPLQTLGNRAPRDSHTNVTTAWVWPYASFYHTWITYILHLKKKTQNITGWLVKKQTLPTYFDACFRFVLREQCILFGIVIKSLFKRLLPSPPIPQFTEHLKFITIESRAAQFMTLLYMKKICHKSEKTVI